MAEKKVTIMVIKVDLNCEKCHKKIKKVLCKIPREYLFLDFFNFLDIYIYILNIRKVTELFCNFGGALCTREIQNQVYDEKANTVTITVVCCSPEKIKKKICCKGGDSVKGIEIKVPEKPKPKEPEKPKEKPKEPQKPKEPEKPKPDKPVVVIVEPKKPKDPEPPPKKPEPTPAPPPKAPAPAPAPPPKAPEPAPAPPPKAPEPAPAPAPAPPPKAPEPVQANPPPVRVCCMECYEGHGGGPCYHGFGRPPPCYEGYGTPAPPPCYEAYGRPVYESWGGGGYNGGCRRGCYLGRCDCLSEENPAGCIVM